MNWLLPEHIADALPAEAAQIERLRREILDACRLRGYELVMPPLLEYLESLLTGTGQDLKLRTFKLVDQASGRTLGLRADITPQVARIDAHLLNRAGVTRLCYCDSVLHTMPASIAASREPIQVGAELYGYAGVAADLEIVRLMAALLASVKLPAARIDLGHVGIFRALTVAAKLSSEAEENLLSLLQTKDVPGLQEAVSQVEEPCRSALLALPELYGDVSVLDKAAEVLPKLPEITAALAALKQLVSEATDLPFSIDLADLRGYHYHNGIVFAAYVPGYPAAMALGGRYDGAGKAFGRDRPATGFSMDLRELARMAPQKALKGAILAPAGTAPGQSAVVKTLREQGEIVVEQLPGEPLSEGPYCDRKLALAGDQWVIEALI